MRGILLSGELCYCLIIPKFFFFFLFWLGLNPHLTTEFYCRRCCHDNLLQFFTQSKQHSSGSWSPPPPLCCKNMSMVSSLAENWGQDTSQPQIFVFYLVSASVLRKRGENLKYLCNLVTASSISWPSTANNADPAQKSVVCPVGVEESWGKRQQADAQRGSTRTRNLTRIRKPASPNKLISQIQTDLQWLSKHGELQTDNYADKQTLFFKSVNI